MHTTTISQLYHTVDAFLESGRQIDGNLTCWNLSNVLSVSQINALDLLFS